VSWRFDANAIDLVSAPCVSVLFFLEDFVGGDACGLLLEGDWNWYLAILLYAPQCLDFKANMHFVNNFFISHVRLV
jgi:hypothetical protein